MKDEPRGTGLAVVVMGVAGCGKSTVGAAIADALGCRLIEGDSLHGEANIAKMSAGTPLTDDDRWPWLDRVAGAMAAARSQGDVVVACSALRRAYRDRLRAGAGGPVTFVWLQAQRAEIERRMARRAGHFMPASLIDSQFATLEPPADEADVITVDIRRAPVDIGADVAARLRRGPSLEAGRMTTVALLGTGLMGAPMARNILKAGFPLSVWNRSADKAQPLEADGARVAASAAEAVTGASIIVTMLSDGPAVADALFAGGVAEALQPGSVVVDMSSIKPAEAQAHAAKLAERGVAYIDAPVSGGTRGAAAGTLAIMAGGDEAAFERARPVMATMGRPVHVGASGSGQLAKLANQAIVAITIGAVAEAMLLSEKGGADPAAIRDALTGGFADSVILQQHGERMSTGNFVPGGLSRLHLKDLDNTLEAARGLGLSLPLTEQLRDRFHSFVHEQGGADVDHSGLYLELKTRNGLA